MVADECRRRRKSVVTEGNDIELHERIKDLRTQAGLSQTELAEKLAVSRQAVSKWESGRGTPNISNLSAIAALFDVSVDYLLGVVPISPTPVVRYPISWDKLVALRPHGKVLKKKTHAAVIEAHPRSTRIWPLIRKKLSTKAERVFDWLGFIFSDTILGTFSSIDALSNRDAYYRVEENGRQFLARVTKEVVESQELLQPIEGSKFTIGMNRFKKEKYPIV